MQVQVGMGEGEHVLEDDFTLDAQCANTKDQR